MLQKDSCLIIDLEIAESLGEDAHTTHIFPTTDHVNINISVFDGLGGRSIGYGGQTGGKIASKIAAQKTDLFLKQWSGKFDKQISQLLRNSIYETLKQEADQNIRASRLKGPLANKRLCTTLALASINQFQDYHNYQINLAWIGDSRIYFLSPEKGLQQLTIDDISIKKDALEMIRQDPPMSKYLTADMSSDWNINFKSILFEERGCILACTDGCFQYLPTPWDFEKLLLRTMSEVEITETISDIDLMQNWKDLLIKNYEDIKQDDISLILYPIGFDSFQALKEAYKPRLDILSENFNTENQNSYDDLVSLWHKYRVDYEAYLPLPESATTSNPVNETTSNPVNEEATTSEEATTTSEEDLNAKSPTPNEIPLEKEINSTDDKDETNKTIEHKMEQAFKFYTNNDFDQAIKIYKEVLDLQPDNIKTNYYLGLSFLNKAASSNDPSGDLKKATEHFLSIICENTHDISHEACQIVSEHKLVEFLSIEQLDKLLCICSENYDKNKTDIINLYLMGQIYDKKNDLYRARYYLREAIQLCHMKLNKISPSSLHDQETTLNLKKLKQKIDELLLKVGQKINNNYRH